MIRSAVATPSIRRDDFARDVQAGLACRPKRIPSTYFYDERGSALFEQITTLDEYYLTRCEREILQTRGAEIARYLPRVPYRLIELGAGDGHKTQILLEQLLVAGQTLEYIPIDICEGSVSGLVTATHKRFGRQQLRVQGIAADYLDALRMLQLTRRQPSVVLWLGSSIGNMAHGEARNFLAQVRLLLQPGDLMLVGFDLKKRLDVLQRAYDDRQGVTREFNLNLLDRINRELGGDFERDHFQHCACYNFRSQCMESWLVSTRRQQVTIGMLDRTYRFAAWEGMRVERSHKYDRARVHRLARAAGFAVREHFLDRRRYFVDSLWQVATG